MSDFLSDDDFERFKTLIYRESGIHFTGSNRTILESRLKERLRSVRVESLGRYYDMLIRDESELRELLDSVTTNLTRFFRNTSHFQTFEYHVLPDLIKWKHEHRQRQIRLWSAGCSTGEEAYSLAIVMKEFLPADLHAEIIASDISLKSLMVGKEGYYPENRMVGVPEKYVKKYFVREGDGYRIGDEIRSMIRFDYHNLKNDSSLQNLDVVFCRNVLIYFDDTAQKAVVNRFWNTMNSHSYLFIGHSESLFGMNTKFEFLKTDWACIYRKFSA